MYKILILEDDVMIASGLTYAIEAEGYEVVPVLRGLGELEAIRALYVEHAQAAIDSIGK